MEHKSGILYIHTNATCIIILIKKFHMWIADLAKATGENEKNTEVGDRKRKERNRTTV